jgi:L-threonylcarbamoyladenylate synthase
MKPVFVDDAAIEYAAGLLRKGRLVAFPTETVYGLGADAANPEAVRKIFQVKGRPSNHPLIVHLASPDQLEDWAKDVPTVAKLLAERFWPGPLAMILNKKSEVPSEVTGGQQTVGLRVPAHPVALSLLRKFGGGIAAPSANRFCRISPTQAQHVEEELGEDVDLILDGGSCQVGVESTIIDLSGEQPRLLRSGKITVPELEQVLKTPLLPFSPEEETDVRAPGMMAVHYAPVTPAYRCGADRLRDAVKHCAEQKLRLGVLLYREIIPAKRRIHVIGMPEQAEAYAQALYSALRDLDHLRIDKILVEEPPEGEAWRAINDRLRKATLPFQG